MADEQVGDAQLVLQVAQQVQHLRLHRHVQRRHRLVGRHHLGAQHQGAGDGDALALAAAELVRVAVVGFGAQANAVQHPPGFGDALGPGAAAVDRQRLDQASPTVRRGFSDP